MKVCPNCNNSCENSDIVCKSCGYLFNVGDPESEQPSGDDRQKPDVQSQQQSGQEPYQQGGQEPYQQGGQNAYGYRNDAGQGFQAVPDAQKNNGMAVASLVLGIVGFCGCSLGGILALIFGIISFNNIKKSGGREKGRGLAVAGIILGAIAILMIVISLLLLALDPAFRDSYEKLGQQLAQQLGGSSSAQ